MNLKSLMSYLGGIMLLAAIVVLASLLPLLFAGDGPAASEDPHTGRETAPAQTGEMSRNEKIELVTIYRRYKENGVEIPAGIQVSSIDPALVEKERMERLYTRARSVVEPFYIDAQFGTLFEKYGDGGFYDSTVYLENGERISVEESGSIINVFKNPSGESIRVWNVYGRINGDWTTWIVLHIDVDSEEIYYFYISSVCLDDGESFKTNSLSGLEDKDIALLWNGAAGLRLRSSAVDSEGVFYYTSQIEDIVAYGIQWVESPAVYDLKLIMMQN